MSALSSAASQVAAVFRRYPYRGKTVIWNLFEPHIAPGEIEVRHAGGGAMVIDTRLFWQRQMMAACFERAGAWVVPRLLQPGETFIDAGANCGYYSCLAAGRVGPSGRVIAFEPDTRLHAQLAKQRDRNRGIIHVEPVALSDVTGTAIFHINPSPDPQGLTIGHGSLESHDGWREMHVETIRLDDYLEQQGIVQVRLAKFDLEGHELQALHGAEQSIRSGRIESVLVEVNDRRSAKLLLSMPWDYMLQVGRRWRPADAATLGASQADVLCLRGEGSRRWRALKRLAPFV